ncbi:MAG TPA: ECF-type sigma factor [Pirellulaceae bacterium]|nr:ECF-type sigma factor [Pirellulaceae bacterium]
MDAIDITTLLHRMGDGDQTAHHELLECVYEELRQMARSKLKDDTGQRSISATALVHEAWLRLTQKDGKAAQWSNRRHFYGAAAEAMRRILIDRARRRQADKRRHDPAIPMPEHPPTFSTPDHDLEILALNDALEAFSQLDAQAATIIKLRYFAGLPLQEIADVLELSRATVVRELTFARSWLKSRLDEPDDL